MTYNKLTTRTVFYSPNKISKLTLQQIKQITMKNTIIILILTLLLSCGQKKQEDLPVETENQTENNVPLKTVSGEVNEIQLGKDGYTTKIITAENDVYFVTISRSNLTNPEQYKSVQLGEQLKVSGDYWTMEGDKQITVREILE